MPYELRNIDGEIWLIQMPAIKPEKLNANEIDNLEYALANLFLQTEDENFLLKLPTGKDTNEIAIKLMTSLLYKHQRHQWDEPPCLYHRIAIEVLFPYYKGWTVDQYQTHLEQIEQKTGSYFGENLSDDSDQDDDDLRKKNPPEYKRHFNDINSIQQLPNFWISTKRQTVRSAGLKNKLSLLINKIQQKDITNLEGCYIHLMTHIPESSNYSFRSSYIFREASSELFYIKTNGQYEKVNITKTKLAKFKTALTKVMGGDKSKYLTDKQLTELITANSGHHPETIKRAVDKINAEIFDAQLKINEIPYADFSQPLTTAQLQGIEEINDIIRKSRTGAYSQKDIQRISELSKSLNLFIAQYRGINYMIDRWNAPSRRHHRGMLEVDLPQYCEMVLRNLEFCFYTQLSETTDYTTHPELQEALAKSGEAIKNFLLYLRESSPVIDFTDSSQGHLYLFNNILERLQHSYSNGINKFLLELAQLREQYPDFWGKLPNAFNPFVSTGNTLYHALKYAYGMKNYYKNPLRPRYQRTGKIEYSHVGKVYVSLHSIENMLLNAPNNVPQMDREGRICLLRDIGPEKETAFLAFIDGPEVIYQYVAKFPDLSHYLPIYEIKYGLDPELFQQFQYLISLSTPHSELRDSTLKLLGKWLCTYHTALLMRIAFKAAQSRKGTLIYLGHDGLLTDKPNKSLLTSGEKNLPLREEVHIHRESRHQLASQLYYSPKKQAVQGFSFIEGSEVKTVITQLDPKVVSAAIKKNVKSQTAMRPEKVKNQKNKLLEYTSPSPKFFTPNTKPKGTTKSSPNPKITQSAPERSRYQRYSRPPSPVPFSLSPIKNGKSIEEEGDLLTQLASWLASITFSSYDKRELFGLKPYEVHYAIGNCLFEAVAAFLSGKTGKAVRELSVKRIQMDEQLQARINALAIGLGNPLRTIDGEKYFNNVEEYINLMNQDQTWGTEIELVALARELQRPLVILTPSNTYDQIIEEDDYAKNDPIFLNYIDENHYEPLAVLSNQASRIILEQVRASIAQRNNQNLAHHH